MVDFFNEVEEELRNDRMRVLIQKYRRPALIGLGVVVLAVLVFLGWHYWDKARVERGSEAFNRGVAALRPDPNGMAQPDRNAAKAAFAEEIGRAHV